MMKHSTPLAVLCLLVVGGCASQSVRWSHPTKGEQAFYAEQSECEARALSIAPVAPTGMGPFADGMEQGARDSAVARIYVNCMRGKGWIRQIEND